MTPIRDNIGGVRCAFAIVALTGCRSILGIEDPIEMAPPIDDASGFEGTMMDAGSEAVNICPSDFSTLPNSGPRGHRYKLINTLATWTGQRDGCVAMNSFLAFPDGATLAGAQSELMAITTLAGAGVWIGIDDVLVEGSYRTSLSQPVSAITAMLITTSGGNPNATDCFSNINAGSLEDEDCNGNRKAVCECVP